MARRKAKKKRMEMVRNMWLTWHNMILAKLIANPP